MADRNKFEEMLERLINEDKAGAEELFHEIVVERSREIYENILAEEADDEEVDEATDEEEVDESDDEEVDEASDDDELDEDFNLDEFEVEGDDEDDLMGGDETDDMLGDLEGGDDDMDMDMGDEGEEELEDRVVDLEDALDELKAEFEKMMSGEEGDDEEGEDDLEMDMDDEEGEEEPEEESYAFEADDEDEDEVEESRAPKSASEQMREYVEKVSAKMGDNGANTKSIVAGKNDMGGTASNIAQGGTEAGVEANKGNLKGSALSDQNAKEDNAGNVNVPGGKASKSLKANGKGHGAEKKGKGESGANTKSIVGK